MTEKITREETDLSLLNPPQSHGRFGLQNMVGSVDFVGSSSQSAPANDMRTACRYSGRMATGLSNSATPAYLLFTSHIAAPASHHSLALESNSGHASGFATVHSRHGIEVV